MLARLVASPTVSQASTPDLIALVRDRLVRHDAPVPGVFAATGTRARLTGRIGPAVAGGVVLSRHGDGMPVTGRDRTSDPCTLTGPAWRLFRRGTCDNGTDVVSCQTGAGQIEVRGLSTVTCGPGAAAKAHQPDECITTDRFDAGPAVMARPIARLAA